MNCIPVQLYSPVVLSMVINMNFEYSPPFAWLFIFIKVLKMIKQNFVCNIFFIWEQFLYVHTIHVQSNTQSVFTFRCNFFAKKWIPLLWRSSGNFWSISWKQQVSLLFAYQVYSFSLIRLVGKVGLFSEDILSSVSRYFLLRFLKYNN